MRSAYEVIRSAYEVIRSTYEVIRSTYEVIRVIRRQSLAFGFTCKLPIILGYEKKIKPPLKALLFLLGVLGAAMYIFL